MNKKNIIQILENYNIKDYIIISGASMVLQGVKEKTKDIDITVNNETYEYLLKKYNCTFEKNVDGYDIWYIDNIINFGKNYYNKIEYIEFENYKVQTLDSILKLKRNLNRKKDKKDIELLENHLAR